MPAELHLWCFGPDTIVAASASDVLQIMQDWTGDDELDDYSGETPTMMADDATLTINFDDEGEPVTKTAREWAESNGEGWLCSTEY